MRDFIFGSVFFLMITMSWAQKSYHQDVVKYFELNGTEKQYSEAVDQMFELLKRQYSTLDIPLDIWQELQGVKEESLKHIKSLLVSVYKSSFSHQDIRELIAFYELSEVQRQKGMPQFLDSAIGKKLASQGESFKRDVAEVSTLWSRDLYKETVEKLKIKGYVMPQ